MSTEDRNAAKISLDLGVAKQIALSKSPQLGNQS